MISYQTVKVTKTKQQLRPVPGGYVAQRCERYEPTNETMNL